MSVYAILAGDRHITSRATLVSACAAARDAARARPGVTHYVERGDDTDAEYTLHADGWLEAWVR